jgi:hypothetical protein
MKKRLTNNGNHITVGLDIGYGVTKAIADIQQVVFPSVWGYARPIKFKADEIAQRYPGDQISDDDGDWFIGDLALSQLRAGEQRNLRGRTADERAMGNVARVRLAKVAIGKMFPSLLNRDTVHVRIATGLPVDHMRDAGELKEALIGQHLIHTDTGEFVANVTEVMVMPQPYGTIYKHILTPSGEVNACHTFRRTGVCDVGTYTIDLALDDDGEYIDVLSGSIEAGVFTAQEVIADAYERDFRAKPGYRDVESILRSGCIRVRGEEFNYMQEVDQALEPLRAACLNIMGNRWQTGAGVDVIYLSGGGASLVYQVVKAAYPQAVLSENSQLANAQGYLNRARFDWGS